MSASTTAPGATAAAARDRHRAQDQSGNYVGSTAKTFGPDGYTYVVDNRYGGLCVFEVALLQ
jgi:hypothetical protein